jgi:thiol-disulfide isomerase/thioredoxin
MKKGVVVAIAIGIAAASGFLAQRQLGTGRSAPAVATPAPAAPPPAPDPAVAQAAAAKPKVPESLPHIELLDRDGRKRALSEWKGRPLMVNYWATWCAPCRREIPLLNQLRAEHAKHRLEVIGIAVDFRDDVLKYAQATTISYPLLIGEEDGLAAVQAVAMEPNFPFTVFADSQQRIVALKVGELHRDDADLILTRVAAVDAGTLSLVDARTQITEGLKALATRRAAAGSEKAALAAGDA